MPILRAIARKPSNLISCTRSRPEGVGAFVGRQGAMKPVGRACGRGGMPVTLRRLPERVESAGYWTALPCCAASKKGASCLSPTVLRSRPYAGPHIQRADVAGCSAESCCHCGSPMLRVHEPVPRCRRLIGRERRSPDPLSAAIRPDPPQERARRYLAPEPHRSPQPPSSGAHSFRRSRGSLRRHRPSRVESR